jgi:hypothetical protein
MLIKIRKTTEKELERLGLLWSYFGVEILFYWSTVGIGGYFLR